MHTLSGHCQTSQEVLRFTWEGTTLHQSTIWSMLCTENLHSDAHLRFLGLQTVINLGSILLMDYYGRGPGVTITTSLNRPSPFWSSWAHGQQNEVNFRILTPEYVPGGWGLNEYLLWREHPHSDPGWHWIRAPRMRWTGGTSICSSGMEEKSYLPLQTWSCSQMPPSKVGSSVMWGKNMKPLVSSREDTTYQLLRTPGRILCHQSTFTKQRSNIRVLLQMDNCIIALCKQDGQHTFTKSVPMWQ